MGVDSGRVVDVVEVDGGGVSSDCGVRVKMWVYLFFFFNDTATTEIYTLSLHDALPISIDCIFFSEMV